MSLNKRIYSFIERLHRHFWNVLRVTKFRLNPNIHIGKNVTIEESVVISTRGGGEIWIGNNCSLFRNSFILTWGGNIKIGDYSAVNAFTTVYGQGGVTIGKGVGIASNCTITPVNHNFDRLDIPRREQGVTKKGIVIEDDVWIGAGCVIVDGVTVGKGSIIGAGSVVTKNTEIDGVYVGVPARKIRNRGL